MDIKEFFDERKRLCNSIQSCESCPIYNLDNKNCTNFDISDEYINRVKKWSEEHPKKTNEMKFIEMTRENFGEVKGDGFSADTICDIISCDYCHNLCGKASCFDCLKFWHKLYEENKKTTTMIKF